MSLPGIVAVADTLGSLFGGSGPTAAYSWNPRALGLTEAPGFNATSWPKPWKNDGRQAIAVRVGDFDGIVLPGAIIYQGNGTKPYLAASSATTSTGLPTTPTNTDRYSWNPRALGLTEGAGYSPLAWPKPWTNVSGRTLSLQLAGTAYAIPHGATIMQCNGSAPYLAAGSAGTETTVTAPTSVTPPAVVNPANVKPATGVRTAGLGTLVVVGLGLWALTRE